MGKIKQRINLQMNNSPAPAIKLEINLDGPKCEAPPAAL